MKKLSKFLAMVLALALTVGLSVSLTVAYLTDTDEQVNVMTLGNVSIEQIEQERDENGDLTDFTQAKPALPAVGPIAWATDGVEVNGVECKVFTPDLKNVVDKIVTVENTGKSDAYVRTIIAIEAPDFDPDSLIHVNLSSEGIVYSNLYNYQIDGKDYCVIVATYTDALAAGEVSTPSLMQVFLDSEADNDDCAAFGDTWEIMVLSQAVQADGFDSAEAALNTAFGEVTEVKAQEWFGGKDPVVVNSSAELASAVQAAAGDSAIIVLEDGNYETNLKIEGGSNITIVGGKNAVLSGQIATTSSTKGTLTLQGVTVKVDDTIKDSTGISQTGKSAIAIWGNQTVVCEGVTFDMSLANSTAITSWWDTGIGTSIVVKNCTFNCNGQRPIRATGNVTVEDTTFNDPYRYAVQLTAKADTATELDKAVINFNNNTIINGANGKTFVYGIQLEGADYGCNDCVINGEGNTIVDGGADSAMYYCECGKVEHETIEWNTEVAPVHEN